MADKKITQLNAYTTPQPTDVSPIVDVGASETKKITFANIASSIVTYIQSSLGGLVQSVTGLNTDNTDPANPVVQISVDGVTITGDGTPGNPLVASGVSGSSGGGVNAKAKSYSLEGLLGTPIQNGYQNIESYITSNGTKVYAELSPDFLQVYDTVADWTAADQINSYVVNQGFLFLLLEDTGTNTYRVYRYAVSNIGAGGTLMTIATQTLGTQDFMIMTSDGTDFFFNYLAGNSANDFDISRYTISGTTLTWVSDTSCGAVAHATDVFIVDSLGHYYGLNTSGTREVKDFNSAGTLQNTYGPYDSNYTNIIRWDDEIYIAKSVGDDEAYRITPSSVTSTSNIELKDEFIGGISGAAVGTGGGVGIGDLGWTVDSTVNIAHTSTNVDANHPGIVALGAASCVMSLKGQIGDLIAPDSTYEFIVKLGAAGNGLYCGITDAPGGSFSGTEAGLVIKASANTWKSVYGDGVAPTVVGSIATTTNFTNLKIVINSTGDTAQFFVNNVLLATQSIVASSSNMLIAVSNFGGGAQTDYIDYFRFTRKVTR